MLIAWSHSDDNHVNATAPCMPCTRIHMQARPPMSCIPLVTNCFNHTVTLVADKLKRQELSLQGHGWTTFRPFIMTIHDGPALVFGLRHFQRQLAQIISVTTLETFQPVVVMLTSLQLVVMARQAAGPSQTFSG